MKKIELTLEEANYLLLLLYVRWSIKNEDDAMAEAIMHKITEAEAYPT